MCQRDFGAAVANRLSVQSVCVCVFVSRSVAGLFLCHEPIRFAFSAVLCVLLFSAIRVVFRVDCFD